jgi:hypothetical protein
MGLGTACKEEILRMKNVSIESSGGKRKCLWVEENCVFKEKFLYIYICCVCMFSLYVYLGASLSVTGLYELYEYSCTFQ